MSFFFFLLSVFSSYQAFSNYKCQTNTDCLRVLHEDYLDKNSDRSLYRWCEVGFENNKACCIDPSSCNEPWGRDLSSQIREKSMSLAELGPACERDSLFGELQKGMCALALENCKTDCERALKEFKRNFKICFGIPSSLSLDEVLEKSKSSSEDHLCYDEMRRLAEKYKFQSLGEKDLRSDLRSEDIVSCEKIEGAGTLTALKTFRKAVCELGRQEKRRLEEEQRKREAREEAKREEKQRLKEEKRLREEELARKRKEEARRIEEVARQIKKDRMRLAQLESSQRSSTSSTPAVSNSLNPSESSNKAEDRKGNFDRKEGERKKSEKEEDKNNNLDDKQEAKKKESKAEDKDNKKEEKNKKDKKKKANKEDEKLKAEGDKKRKQKESNNKKDTKGEITSHKTSVNKRKKNKTKISSRKKLDNKTRALKEGKSLNNSSQLKPKKRSKSHSNLKTQKQRLKFKSEDIRKANNKQSSPSQSNVSESKGFIEEKCPIKMPTIKSALVFQSVKAPTKESRLKQEYQEKPDKPSFTSYDLVHKKPAGLLVEVEGFTSKNRGLEFNLSLKIETRKEITKCFHNPLNGQTMIGGNEAECSFTGYDNVYGGPYKFMPFPRVIGISGKTRKALLKLSYKSHKACEEVKSFELNITNIDTLRLGFTGISDKKCKVKGAYEFEALDKFQLIEDFRQSKEVSQYIESMFPIDRLRTFFIKNDRGVKTTTIGNCNNTPSRYNRAVSVGVLKDTKKLELKRREAGVHKIIAVVPQDYFLFHYKNKDWRGLVVRPVFKKPRPILEKFLDPVWLGGSWNITLIREDTEDKGVISHELGHLLGQGKEFYQKFDKNDNPLPLHQQSKCKRFRGSPQELCHEYQIKRGLQARKSKIRNQEGKRPILWRFIENRFSIMNSREDIDELWIDRETYQKNFKALSENVGAVAKMDEDFLDRESRQQIVFSGLYDFKRKQVILSETQILKTKIKTPSFAKHNDIPIIELQLKYKDKVIQKMNHPTIKLEIKLIHKDGTHKKIPNSLSPFLAVFNLNTNYTDKTFYVNAINPQTKELVLSKSFNLKVKKREKKKEKEYNKRNQKDKEELQDREVALLFDNFKNKR